MKEELVDQYLKELKCELRGFSDAEKREITEDIKTQISEKQTATNLPISVILNSFGSPQELARTYKESNEPDSYLNSPKNMMESYLFYGLSDKLRIKKD